MINFEKPAEYRIALHHLAFRPFFILAALVAIVAMLAWTVIYHYNASSVVLGKIPAVYWHAHEMIFGYGLAVVTGFLLTAMKNWTGVQTLHGAPLIMLALCWLLARIMALTPFSFALTVTVILDLLFATSLCMAALWPIVRAKQWKQIGVWSKVMLLMLGNVFFYLGVVGVLSDGVRWGLYTGLYILLSLILLMGRRVIPFFIEKGVGYSFQPVNRKWIDLGSLVLMLAFWLLAVFTPWSSAAALASLALFLLHALRMKDWYTQGIWHKPLLWVLYLAYGWIVVGFGLYALATVTNISPTLATHAFAYGGVGLMTLGMMARVSLGHTGRDVFNPPAILSWMFVILFLGAMVRVLAPLVFPDHYTLWIGVSQILWIAGFLLFAWVYIPVLIKPRVDGQYG